MSNRKSIVYAYCTIRRGALQWHKKDFVALFLLKISWIWPYSTGQKSSHCATVYTSVTPVLLQLSFGLMQHILNVHSCKCIQCSTLMWNQCLVTFFPQFTAIVLQCHLTLFPHYLKSSYMSSIFKEMLHQKPKKHSWENADLSSHGC